MRKQLLLASLLALLFCSPICADPMHLKTKEIQPTFQEMLGYHVEFKEISPAIVKRSLKIYFEQFDREKIYLLAHEVAPFLDLSESNLNEIIEDYKTGDFSAYLQINRLIIKTIRRTREIRNEIQKELILSRNAESFSGESYLYFAPNESGLKNRIRQQQIRFLLSEERPGIPWTPERRQKILALFETRLKRFEDNYLLQDDKGKLLPGGKAEHQFTLHTLKALAKSLDAHTSYFSPEEAYEMRSSLEKEFQGVGVILKESVDGVVISGLVRGGSAERSGKLNIGDIVLEIDGRSFENASYEELLNAMKGNGKEITLGIKRFDAKGFESHHSVYLKREKILLEDERLRYSYEPVAGGIIGKLTLPSFYEGSDASSCQKDMREAIKSLKMHGNLLGLILDLRENSGGFLNQAVKVSGLFVSSGVIVISKYARGEIKYLRDIDGRLYYNGPILVLTSKASASAAEIVAQALQDYGAALVVGDERTYGKGTIQYQTVTDPRASSFFKVTVGKYYTVSGKSTQIDGVKADIIVPTKYAAYQIGERYLEYPLVNDYVPPAYSLPPRKESDYPSLFQRHYLPAWQIKDSLWRKMLPILKTNSQKRLLNDPNFKAFTKYLENPSRSSTKTWGDLDLQMEQSVQILKDMIYLRAQGASQG